MWLTPLSHWLITVTLLAQPAAAPPGAMPELISTRQSVFAIPFVINRTDDPARQPVELQLYVSTDRGAHWQLYGKAQPSQQHFLFRAGADGEYWFAIRTIDRAGQARPETISTPGQRVVVDTKPMLLKLTAKPGPDGQVSVLWETERRNIKPNSLNMQYRASNTEAWQPVAIEPRSPGGSNLPPRGETRFRPRAGANDIQIRAEIADLAGNVAVGNAQVKLNQDPVPALAATTEPRGSVAIAINPAVGNKFSGADRQSDGSDAASGLPPGEHPRMVNSRLFELEYDVDSAGPSGVGRVELWGTRDGGRTWRRFTVNNDNHVPLTVSVEDEGLYGFRLVATNGAGLGGKPPAAGDLPDLWIGVDLTKPTARVVSSQQGVDAEAGHLIISWQADDRMLAARPVSLSFSPTRTGPWLPIASGLENTGRYAWPIDGRTPPQFYVRLEVRDEAGNIGVHETPDPVTIDQSQPTIRVKDVHPVGQTSARPTQRLR